MHTFGTLFVVATPIGNLEDITLRALRVLQECDYILCEDTRVTKKLLKHYGIDTKLKRYDAHTSEHTHENIIAELRSGQRIALVSDAGTPGISDPGVRLVEQTRALKIPIEAIPGPSALTAAISIAGCSGNQFTFLGFVPQKKGRETFFTNLEQYPHPVVFFESTHRIVRTLTMLAKIYPERKLMVARELTKLHEEVLSGTPDEIRSLLEDEPVKQKGEFVVLFNNQISRKGKNTKSQV